jgi:DNA (cytosine-5)-methyltransferase 1
MKIDIKKIAAIDLFCGIGGLTKGLEMSGVPVVAGFDIDESCRFIYESNTKSAFVNKDVQSINIEELRNFYPKDSEVRVLVGCAPCQPFSRLSGKYRMKGQRDPKWRLLYSFSDIIEAVQPDIVSMENVPDIVHHDVLVDFTRKLEDNGYHIWCDVVACARYGVPQNRKRFVLLASKHGEINLIDPIYREGEYLTVRDAIGMLKEIPAGGHLDSDPMHRSCRLSRKNLERIRQSRPGGTWKEWEERLRLDCHKKNAGKTYGSVYGRMSWDAPSPTITTQFYGYGNGRFGHPEQDRAISLREGALLQSFPNDYIFCDNDHPINVHDMGVHIGNAVPVKLGEAIGCSIIQHISRIEYKEQVNHE